MGWFTDALSAVTGVGGAIGGLIQGQQNLAFQKENLAYQKQLQQQIFDREDNAVQRRAADLEKAGLSKTLAAGDGAGAGSVISTTAPQNDTLGRVSQGLALGKQIADISQVMAQTSNEVKRGQQIDTGIEESKARIAETQAKTLLANKESMLYDEKTKAMIREAEVRTDEILARTDLTKAQASNEEYRRSIMEAELARIILDNEMKGYENVYTDLYGMKMGTAGVGNPLDALIKLGTGVGSRIVDNADSIIPDLSSILADFDREKRERRENGAGKGYSGGGSKGW